MITNREIRKGLWKFLHNPDNIGHCEVCPYKQTHMKCSPEDCCIEKICGDAKRKIGEEKAQNNKIDEFEFILDFVKDGDFSFDVCRKQLRSLWTAYCLHKGYECDTLQYDTDLTLVWRNMLQYGTIPWKDDMARDLFDAYMREELS